ncbi:MAG: diguanylate cyclase [Actinobacteria bacterium]|nr:MAG: diguanylate cyclase [Actinomycetota bacterium]
MEGHPLSENLKSIFSSASYPVYAIDTDYNLVFISDYFKKVLGLKDCEGKKCYQVFSCKGKGSAQCELHQMLSRKRPFRSQVIIDFNKKKKVFALDFAPLKNEKNKIFAGLGIGKDITNNKILRQQIVQSNRELKVINSISHAICQHLDLDRLLDTALDKVIELLRFDMAGFFLLNEDNHLVLKSHRGLSEELVKAVKTLEPGIGSPWLSLKKGKPYAIEDITPNKTVLDCTKKEKIASIVNIPLKSKNRLLGTLTLFTKEKRVFGTHDLNFLESIGGQLGVAIENAMLHKQAIGLARTDGLTGLYNFRYFVEILNKEIHRSQRGGLEFALMMIDIDNLKDINDFYGHEAGDFVMRKFSDLLRLNLRDSDFYARYGGDEFVLLLPETDEKAAISVAKKIITKTSKMMLFGFDTKPVITASMGVAIYPKAATTPSSMLKAADLAMYQAKQDGKNRYCYYSPALLSTIQFDSKRLERIAQNADLSAIQTLITAVDLRDNYTGSHSSEVSRLSLLLAKTQNLREAQVEELKVASLLHDIGKIGISDSVLLKPTRLSKKEYEQVKQHPLLGVSILKFSKHFKKALPIILHHHERFDGKGYPHGLSGETIPYLARLIAICDAFQAMVSSRPYRKAMNYKRAFDEIKANSGTQFDPQLVDAFKEVLTIERNHSGNVINL